MSVRFVLVGSGTRHARDEHRPAITQGLRDLLDFVGVEVGDEMTYVHGAAPGFDRISAEVMGEWGADVMSVPAKWQDCGEGCPSRPHLIDKGKGPFCPLAGGRRNQLMLDEYQPAAMLAMPLKGLGGRASGTRDAIQRGADFGLTVVVRALDVPPPQGALWEPKAGRGSADA